MKLIVAAGLNWEIGKDGKLLFSLPDDMKYFRTMTKNKIVVMGRKTLESFPGAKPLKERVNIVLSSNVLYNPEGCIMCRSYNELRKVLDKYDMNDVFLIGGGKVYNDLYAYCTEAYITKVNASASDADTHLHNFDEDDRWELASLSNEYVNNEISFRFAVYVNKCTKDFLREGTEQGGLHI